MKLIDSIAFWILILIILGIAIWLAFGSPEFNSSLIAIIIFVAMSEIYLWKAFFKIDKKTSLGFGKVRSEFKITNHKLKDINSRLSAIAKDIIEIKNSIIK
jgi:hypothetical protein